MSILEIALSLALCLLLIVEIISYRAFVNTEEQFEKTAQNYVESFIALSKNNELIADNAVSLGNRQNDIIEHLTGIETIIELHSEVLKTRLLVGILENLTPINKE